MTRTLPRLDEINRFFWTGGADGVLRFQRCGDCGHYQHPPSVVCSKCLAEKLSPEAVAGTATVAAVTVNHQPWAPGMKVPFVIAIIEFDEQPGLRLTTNVIGVEPELVHIGQRVRVVFEQVEDVWLPLCTPL